MSVLVEPRRIAWIAVSAVSGLIVGQLVVCPGGFWRGIFVLGFVPGMLQGLVLWRSQPLFFVRWLALTQFGVITAYVFTLVALLGLAGLVNLLVPAMEPSERAGPSFVGWLIFFAAFFIGGAGLGGLQVTGFPRRQRHARWVLATMLGCAAVAPIAVAVTGLGSCEGPLGLPNQLVGIIGGSLYGLITAITLPPLNES